MAAASDSAQKRGWRSSCGMVSECPCGSLAVISPGAGSTANSTPIAGAAAGASVSGGQSSSRKAAGSSVTSGNTASTPKVSFRPMCVIIHSAASGMIATMIGKWTMPITTPRFRLNQRVTSVGGNTEPTTAIVGPNISP